jgi:hypothetical protein
VVPEGQALKALVDQVVHLVLREVLVELEEQEVLAVLEERVALVQVGLQVLLVQLVELEEQEAWDQVVLQDQVDLREQLDLPAQVDLQEQQELNILGEELGIVEQHIVLMIVFHIMEMDMFLFRQEQIKTP